MPATLILADHTGRLGNKLILFSHVIAAAEEYSCRVINLSILPAAHYFEGLHLNPLGEYPKRFFPIDLRWLFRVFRKPIQDWVRGRRGKPPLQNRWLTVLDMENKPVYRLDSPEFAALTRSSRWIILWGYPYRCPALVIKYQEKIRKFFKVRQDTGTWARRVLQRSKSSSEKSLAIHIRQGDFKDPQHADLFVPPEVFAEATRSYLAQPESPTKVWVCSDEAVPPALFPTGACEGTPRALGEDLVLMQGADLLVGFESTLSLVMAFTGSGQKLRICPETKRFVKDGRSVAEA